MELFFAWFFEWLRALLMFIGFVACVLFALHWVDQRKQRRERLAGHQLAVRAPKAQGLRLHGAGCRCTLCSAERKGEFNA